MFDKLSKNQKIIIYFLIVISFLFLLPILFWCGFFIGYNTAKNRIKYEVESVLDTSEIENNEFLEIKI